METVERLGKIGEIVDVADGYARNYLMPKGLGVITTPRNVKALEHTKKVVAAKIKKEKCAVEGVAQKIATLALRIPVEVNADGKLFGSVAAQEIVSVLAAEGIAVERHNIALEKPIKECGTFYIPVALPHDCTASVKVEVVPASPA